MLNLIYYTARAADISFSYPWTGVQDVAGLVNNFYLVALGIIGVAALGVIIYGGILFIVSAGNSSRQGDAREWIMGGVWGLVLLLCGYLILYTINPNLVILQNPNVTPVSVGPIGSQTGTAQEGESCSTTDPTGGCVAGLTCYGGTCQPVRYLQEGEVCRDGYQVYQCAGGLSCRPVAGAMSSAYTCQRSAGSLTEADARQDLVSAGVGVKSDCPAGQSTNCVDLEGIQQKTIDEVVLLSSQVGSSNVYVTAGTEGCGTVHSAGVYSHCTGYKVDLRLDPDLNSYITGNYINVGTRSDGAPLYKSPSGSMYALESDHWDVLVR